MGKKGKGRQAGGFGSKSQRAAHWLEWQEQVQDTVKWHGRPNRATSPSLSTPSSVPTQRPRLTRLGQLKGILRERLHEESYELLERRRRAGFVPGRSKAREPDPIRRLEAHPPGWILRYREDDGSGETLERDIASTNSPLDSSLQSKCMALLSRYIVEYLEAMGKEELHAQLALLPSETLSSLSVSISETVGISNELAYVVGKHAHLEELCLRSGTHAASILTDSGLLELVPRLPNRNEREEGTYQETWDDWEEAFNDESDNSDAFHQHQDLVVNVLQLDGVNVGLKRLELIDCLYLSADAVLALLEKCSCITHLSLAGSIQVVDDGVGIIQALPDLLPALKILDVTRCGWMSAPLLTDLIQTYQQRYPFRKSPTIHCQGCFLPEQMVREEIVGGHKDW